MSPRYPDLVVHDLGVTSAAGDAVVVDKAIADALEELPPGLGVRTADGRRVKDAASTQA